MIICNVSGAEPTEIVPLTLLPLRYLVSLTGIENISLPNHMPEEADALGVPFVGRFEIA